MWPQLPGASLASPGPTARSSNIKQVGSAASEHTGVQVGRMAEARREGGLSLVTTCIVGKSPKAGGISRAPGPLYLEGKLMAGGLGFGKITYY